MAALATIPELLQSIQQSVDSVAESTTALSSLPPPAEGLSLLDVKNELLLSYLEHMVFLVLLKLRRASSSDADSDGTKGEGDLSSPLGQATVRKLVELRLYLEKGVRPLEDKLRYQIEKALRAAETAERLAKQKADASAGADSEDEDESSSGSDDSDDDASDDNSDSDSDSDGSDGSDGDGFGKNKNYKARRSIPIPMDDNEVETSRPNRGAFVRPQSLAAADRTGAASGGGGSSSGGVGVYRPPKIAPTMMPSTATERRQRAERRPLKSATMDEFIADEFSTAPVAEPSIGTNIAHGGRHMKTTSERELESERREYEERNFVRLPKESKKDKAKRARAEGRTGGRDSSMTFGGEDWRGLGEGVDRINRLTQRKSSSGGGASSTRALLDKSRKRGIDTVDGPRGSGHSSGVVGERFEKRLRLQEMGRRDRGRNKR